MRQKSTRASGAQVGSSRPPSDLAPTRDELLEEVARCRSAGIRTVRLEPRSRGWLPLSPRHQNGEAAEPPLLTEGAEDQLVGKGGWNLGHWLEDGLTQIDPDWPEACETARERFSRFGLPCWGRRSKSYSGFLVRSAGLTSYDFQLPQACKSDERFPAGDKQLLVLQLRSSKGTNTMGPPSLHPDGERIGWHIAPAEAGVPELAPELVRREAGLAALLAVVQRCYPGRGDRNQLMLRLAGALCHNGFSAEEADAANRWIAERNGDEQAKSRQQAKSSEAKLNAGKKTMGLPKLVELLGLPKECIATFKEWLSPQVAEDRAGFPDLTEKGGRRPTLPNTKVAIDRLGIRCSHDLFKQRHYVNGEALAEMVGEISDPVLYRLREMIYEQFGFDPVTATVRDAVLTHANHHRFHPVRDYLDGLTWDGTPRLDRWLTTYGGAKDAPHIRAVAALVLIAAVRRVRQPGCKFDELLVLEGEEEGERQGKDKSTALSVLAVRPEWFSDSVQLNLTGREAMEALAGIWIGEIPELKGLRGAAIEKVKAFLSRTSERSRPAYGYSVVDAPRQCVLIGTTNEKNYLADRTGNRRFWPVVVVRFDIEALTRDRDQLWAEAAHREARGESIRLAEEHWAAWGREQRGRLEANPFEDALAQHLRALDGRIGYEALFTLLDMKPGQRRQQHYDLIAEAMVELGWEKLKKQRFSPPSQGGRPERGFGRGSEPRATITAVRDMGMLMVSGGTSREVPKEMPEWMRKDAASWQARHAEEWEREEREWQEDENKWRQWVRKRRAEAR